MMRSAATNAYPHLPDPGKRTAERWAGWIFAVCLHIGLFAWLWMEDAPKLFENERQTIRRIEVVFTEPEPVVETTNQQNQNDNANETDGAPPQLLVEDAVSDPMANMEVDPARTVQNVQTSTDIGEMTIVEDSVRMEDREDVEEIMNALAEEMIENEAKRKAARESQNINEETIAALHERYTPEQIREIRKLQNQANSLARENELRGKLGSSTVEQMVAASKAEHLAQQTLFSSEGLDSGAIRRLDISGVPQEDARKVMLRYGMSVTVANLESGVQSSFLNSAVTERGRFYNKEGKGVYQVFSYGQVASRRMAELEVQALQKRGLDPDKTRVIEIVFGIVSAGGGYDLGVKKLRAERVPE